MTTTSKQATPGAPRIGYLIPEFPGQTHIWMWREIVHLREWGVKIKLYSTRRPPERDRARHGFAAEAVKETEYLWPQPLPRLLGAMLWALATRPVRLVRCMQRAATLPVERKGGRRPSVLALLPVACLLARDMKRAGLRHMHCHTCASGAVLAMLAEILVGVPYSMTLNANLEWWGGAMEEKLSQARFTIAITHWLLEQIHQDYPDLPREKALLGRIGVDTRKWMPRGETASDAGAVFRLATLSRLHTSKGHDVLLRAAALAAAKMAGRMRLHLTIIGDGPERESLPALAKELKIADSVTFTGSLGEEAVIQTLAKADAFVLASHSEPLGVAYMEAMALALPTVGTAAGGVGEIIEDGVTGWLVPPANPEALAARIVWLMENPEDRRSVAEAGRRSVEREFDSRVGAATVYEQVVGMRPEVELPVAVESGT